jgi:hypothetical protein
MVMRPEADEGAFVSLLVLRANGGHAREAQRVTTTPPAKSDDRPNCRFERKRPGTNSGYRAAETLPLTSGIFSSHC